MILTIFHVFILRDIGMKYVLRYSQKNDNITKANRAL